MSNLVNILLEKLGSIPKLIDACSFYITCAGIKELVFSVGLSIAVFMIIRLTSKIIVSVIKEVIR